MTSYHGGKQRIGKEIAKQIYIISTVIIEDNTDFKIKGYCEPFCGMLGVYRHIPELFEDHKPRLKYKAGDANESVIMMWKKAQKGWIPKKHYTKQDYETLKIQKKPSADKGFVAHSYTFRGISFGGYFKHKQSKLLTQIKRIQDIAEILHENNVDITPKNYDQFSQLKGYIIYCDPPYMNSGQRYYDEKGIKRTFDTDEFWKWCDKMSKHNIVFISEYSTLFNIEPIYSKNVKITGTGNNDKKSQRKENLYVLYNHNV